MERSCAIGGFLQMTLSGYLVIAVVIIHTDSPQLIPIANASSAFSGESIEY